VRCGEVWEALAAAAVGTVVAVREWVGRQRWCIVAVERLRNVYINEATGCALVAGAEIGTWCLTWCCRWDIEGGVVGTLSGIYHPAK